ncbi:MAG: hypothetical protein K5779_06955 [Saccharofermentans sp.]|nr:hypothetical protein [Saccharofermentans sp.]
MKRFIRLFSVIVLVVMLLSNSVAASTVESYDLNYKVDNKAARSVYHMVNDWRTSGDAWYWNSSNTSKIQCGKLSAFSYDYNLELVALQRAYEIAISFSHTRPDGSAWYTCECNGTSSYGENIAAGYMTAESVFLGWREDDCNYAGQGHRRNMANSDFTAIGVAHVEYNGRHFWVQEFGYDNSGALSRVAIQGERTGTVKINSSSGIAAPVKKVIKNGWQKENNNWYYYDNGTKVTGWYNANGWYFFDDNGVMQTGWVSENGTWYYLGVSGAMATGWIKSGNAWYYMRGSGAMATGWQQVNDSWYYLESSGAMRTGWIMSGGKWYYLGSSGKMASGWINENNSWYYTDSSGALITGWKNIDGSWYYFDNSGVMATGTKTIGDKDYSFGSNGHCLNR